MFRSTRTVIVLGIAVQIAAFARTVIIAAALGTSLDVDAYNLGLIAPSFISTVIGAWLQMGFIGRYTALITTGEIDRAAAYRSRMLVLVLACATAFAGLCFLLPEQIMNLFLPRSQTAAVASAAAGALHLAGLILVPVIFGDFLGFILNSHGRFFAAALAPLVNALVSVVGLWVWPTLNLSVLVWTLLLGSLAQCLVVMAALLRIRLNFPFKTGAAKGEVRVTLALALPLLPAMMLANSAAAIIQFRSAGLGEGAVATYGYASRLHGALAQVFIMGLSTVLLPHFAALWSRGQKIEILILFRRLVRSGLFMTSYLCLGIYLMGNSTVSILLQRGAFDASHAAQVNWLWTLLSLSLFPYALGTFIAKFCQALRGAGSILVSGVISFASIWLVTAFGVAEQNLSIVIGAVAVGAATVTCFWLVWLARRVPIMPILTDIGVGALRTGLVLLPAAVVERLATPYAQGLPDLAGLLIRGSLFSLVALSLLVATQSHMWFLARRPGADM